MATACGNMAHLAHVDLGSESRGRLTNCELQYLNFENHTKDELPLLTRQSSDAGLAQPNNLTAS
jgi:hypothetical protein